MEPAEFRERFPILREKTYLASCSQGALSPQVRAAMGAFLDSWDRDGNPWEVWVEESDRLRAEFAGLIGADADEVAITFSASSALNAVVSGLDLRGGPRLLAADLEFPAVGQILLAQAQRGAVVDFVPERGGQIVAGDLAEAPDGRTALAAATHDSGPGFCHHGAAMEPAEFRERFPIFRERTYLASCSQGALSPEVRAAMSAFLDSWDRDGNPWGVWVEESDRLRAEFAELIGAGADEVAITFSASSALNAVVGGLDLRERPRLLATDLEFPTVGQILLAQAQRGAEVAFVPERDGAIAAADLTAALDARTALVAATHVAYRTGARLDVAAAARAAHDAGALFLLDAYQSLGTQPIDVHTLGVDVLVGGALKYLLGPAGVAFLYVRRELIDRLRPLDSGWFAQEDPFAFDTWHLRYAASANRFQSGSPPVPSVYGARAGLALVREAGVEAVAAQVERLATRLIEGASAAGYQVRTPRDPGRRGPLVVIGTPDAERLASLLRAEGIVCAPRTDGLRAGFHLYNLEEDVDRLLDHLSRHRHLLQSPQPA